MTSRIQVHGEYEGSVPSGTVSGTPAALSVEDAFRRGIHHTPGIAGVADTTEVVQALQPVAVAEQDFITVLLSFHLAQVILARANGPAEQGISHLLRGK